MQPLAFLNGRFLPAAEAAVPLYDAGFVQGTTVAEQLRTFSGKLFRLEAHLQRLMHSLEIVGVNPGLSPSEMADIARELATRNHALLAAGDDLGMSIFVTPGAYPTMVSGSGYGPTVCMHTFPLPFRFWAEKYEQGEAVVTTNIEQVSPRSWPPELKCRSRMHYYLADRQARQKESGARALMLDSEGFVTEATTANLLIYTPESGLLTPPRHKVLPGISLAVLAELAAQLGIAVTERDLTLDEVTVAAEVLLTSTSPCVLPVVRCNGSSIGSGQVGPVQGRLLAAWNDLVGLDLPAQAVRFAARG